MLATRLQPVTYTLRCTDGPTTDNWRVHRFRMREAINEPYQMLLEVVADSDEVELEDMLGASIELELERGEQGRVLLGVVAAIDWLGLSAGSNVRLRLDVRPAFAMLEQRIHSRLWQDASVLDIVDEVLGEALGEYGRSHDLGSVSTGQSPRSYCVQYNESDLAFVSRLLEEEGISYCFVHDADKGHEVLTLFDAAGQLDPALNVDESELFPYIDHDADHVVVESVQEIEWQRRLASTGTLRRDFDWLDPAALLSSEAGDVDDRGRKRRVYAHGQRRFETDDLGARAGERTAAEALTGLRGRGRSNAADFHAGRTLAVEGHDLPVFAEDLVITAVEHDGEDASALMHAAEVTVGGYRNFFECVPASAELRPRPLTPKPRVHGPQTAIVCGAAGEEIDTDEHGRIRVQFHWQEEPTHDSRSSCWVRVAQSWAGPNWGAQFIPRIGMEVVVEFLEGNPDRPLVTGCVYNSTNTPPYPLPDEKTKSTIKSNSSKGGGGFNEFRFEDA
ncbi:MAG: type VI secretion system tip protein VgrG, partial [Myxococcales bacterium]|nr:type VI secretion system tip protein VgrG [Myxococcales bacterium]